MIRKICGAIYVVSFVLFPLLVLSPAIESMSIIPRRLIAFCVLSIGGAILFRIGWPRQNWGAAFVLTITGYATAYKLASFIPDVSSYPFSLAWSEASRYYYASLWLSREIYGFWVPPSVLHPTRYLLQAIPFLIPNASLWLSRFWQVILWIATAGATSWMLVRRLDLPQSQKPLVVTLSTTFVGFLFLFQGPVYYHLLLMVILVLWGFNNTRTWRTLLVVLIASLWAGISRVNWLPVPGLLAAALYFIEVKTLDKPLARYLAAPIMWVLAGTVAGYASQLAYQHWSGNPPAWFGSSLTSDLLWYRLLSNPTYPMGILPSAILVSFPLVGLMILRLVKRGQEFHWIRLFGLAIILFALFAGGVIVSVKIGGGSNLHNLDAYLTLLLVIGSMIFFDRFQPDQPVLSGEDAQENPFTSPNVWLRLGQGIFLVAVLIVPLYFTLIAGGVLPKRDFTAAQAALQTINNATQQATRQGGEVLFIGQRHLLTFGYVRNVPLVPEYELVFLMEMAMSNNAAYMGAFQADISRQRFAMIVAEPLLIQYQGKSRSFGEENDAWVRGVSEPVLCYYAPSITLDSVGLILYTPRLNPCK